MSTTPPEKSPVSTTAYDATTEGDNDVRGNVGVYGDSNVGNTPASTPGVKVYDRPEGGAAGGSSMMGIIGAVLVILIIFALLATFTNII